MREVGFWILECCLHIRIVIERGHKVNFIEIVNTIVTLIIMTYIK